MQVAKIRIWHKDPYHPETKIKPLAKEDKILEGATEIEVVVAAASIEIVIEGIVSVGIGHVEGVATYCGFLGTN